MPSANGQGNGKAPQVAIGHTSSPRLRRPLRDWRVRSRLVLLVVIPALTALVLGGIRINQSIQSATAFQRSVQLATLSTNISTLVQRLQDESGQTVYFIAEPAGRACLLNGCPQATEAAQGLNVVVSQQLSTDQAVKVVSPELAQIGGSFPAQTQQEAATARYEIMQVLPQLRASATANNLPALVVLNKYTEVVDDLLQLVDASAQGAGDATLVQEARVLGIVTQMKDDAAEERALLVAGLLSVPPGLSTEELSALTAAQADRVANLTSFDHSATPAQQALLTNSGGPLADQAPQEESEAISLQQAQGNLHGDPTTADDWYGAMSHVVEFQFGSTERSLDQSVLSRATSLRNQAVTTAITTGVAVLLLLGLAVLFTVVVARSMVGPLRRLRARALEIAGVQLPETVRRMSEGVASEAPLDIEPIDVDSTDEIGEVARAFDQVHREAVRLAANEAALRGNVNAMFVNLSRRSQSLVERQIRLIDDLEQGEQDSERLASLFNLDHLATRMRRNSENLLVLAGHELSRRWSQAVALVDVLRAAVSEIEQYERVTLNVQPGISVRGFAVNDTVHLLAELVENATSFSASDTPVSVSGHLLNSGGVLIDITDQGVGMGAEEMAHANWRLDNPPVVDVAVSRRMGLFVVARLAARHGVRVRLRHASAGGLTALVWLPDEVISHDAASPPSLSGFDVPTSPGPLAGVSGVREWPPGRGEPDERSAAAQAVTAARTPRFTPLRPDLGDTAAFTAIGAEDSPVPAQATPPLTERNVPGSRPPDVTVPPAPIDVPPRDRDVPGTAEAAEPAPAAEGRRGDGLGEADLGDMPGLRGGAPRLPQRDVSGREQPAAGRREDLLRPTNGGGEAPHSVIVPPAAGMGEANRLPIFESVESDWFRRGRHGAGDRPAETVETAAVGDGWTSPADEGFRAAEVAHAPVSGGTTVAGLPKRVPQANLVPGGVGGGAAVTTAPPPTRSASQARDRLASFQRGIREAREAARDRETDGEDNL